jgi:hypothetical protein
MEIASGRPLDADVQKFWTVNFGCVSVSSISVALLDVLVVPVEASMSVEMIGPC